MDRNFDKETAKNDEGAKNDNKIAADEKATPAKSIK